MIMQKYLFFSLCILATLVSINARPWYDYNDYGDEGEMDYGGNDFRRDDGYRFNSGYRSSVAYGDRFGYHSQSGYELNAGGAYNGGGGAYNRGGGGYRYDGERGYERRSHKYDFLPRHCDHCDIKSFGNGIGQTNTFNLEKGQV